MPKTSDGFICEGKAKGKFVARISFTDASGKRCYLKETCTNRTNAKDALDRLRAKVKKRKPLLDGSAQMSLDSYLDHWLETVAKLRLASRTFEDYSELLARHVRPQIGKKRLDLLRPLDVQNLYAAMHAKGLGRRTRYTHAVLSSALNDAVKGKTLEFNPCKHVSLPKVPKSQAIALSLEEAARFVKTAKTDRYGTMYILALETGLRPEEYTALLWPDIDFDRQVLTVNRVLIWHRRGGGWHLDTPKTHNSRRNVPLSQMLIVLLKDQRKRQSEERLKGGQHYQQHNLVFAGELGHALYPPNLLRRHFKPILERAELPGTITPYALRHSCATLALAAGEHPKVIAERLGHSTIRLTMDTYAHVSQTMQQQATDKLALLIYGESPKTNHG